MSTAITPYDRKRAYAGMAAHMAGQLSKPMLKKLSSYVFSEASKIVSQRAPPAKAPKSSKAPADVTYSPAPAAISSSYTARRARTTTRGKSTTVTHSELLSGTVYGSSTFAVMDTYNLNPGLKASFPWLSVQAAQYEMYRFKSLRYEWVPIAPTSTQGDVMLIPEYNALSPSPTTEQQALDHEGAIIGSVWKPMVLTMNQTQLHAIGPKRYIRDGNVYGDLKTYDCGKLYVAANNEVSGAAIGKLFVHYTVEFFNPVLETTTAFQSLGHSIFTNTEIQSFANTVAEVLGTNYAQANPLSIIYTNGNFILPRGAYVYWYNFTAHDTANEAFSVGVVPEYNSTPITGGGAFHRASGTAAGGYFNMSGTGMFVSDGSSIFTIMVTMYGSGTLSAPADTQVMFAVA